MVISRQWDWTAARGPVLISVPLGRVDTGCAPSPSRTRFRNTGKGVAFQPPGRPASFPAPHCPSFGPSPPLGSEQSPPPLLLPLLRSYQAALQPPPRALLFPPIKWRHISVLADGDGFRGMGSPPSPGCPAPEVGCIS